MKADKTIVEQRINELVKMLLKGSDREEMFLYCSENYGIGERQTDNYIQRAKDKIELSVKKSVEYDYSKAVRRYEDLYKASLNKEDFRTALAVNKELTTLQGLYKLQVEHSGDIQFICNIPD